MTVSRQRVSVPGGLPQSIALVLKKVDSNLVKLVAEINSAITVVNTTLAAAIQDVADDLAAAIDDLDDIATTLSPGLVQLATQTEMEDIGLGGVTTDKAVVPSRVRYHPGVCKVWSLVTVSGGTHTLVASYNVSSITDGSTGVHTITINSDFTDANWTCLASAEGAGQATTDARVASVVAKTAESVSVVTYDLGTGLTGPVIQDAVTVSMAGFGDCPPNLADAGGLGL